MNDYNDHNPEIPETLRDLEASLEALGERTRASAPDDLGDRIADKGASILLGTQQGELRLAGTEAEPARRWTLPQHWSLAASITLLLIAVVAAIMLQQPAAPTGPMAGADTDTDTESVLDDEWIEFETAYVSDTAWTNEAFTLLSSELDSLESNFSTVWTLDENLNLNEEESL